MSSRLENRITSSSAEGSDGPNSPIYLDTYFRPGASGLAVLVVHKNGGIRCLSEDLLVEHWASNVELGEQNVRFVTTISIEQAQSGLLKDREDILAAIGHSQAIDSNVPSLLVLVTSTSDSAGKESVMLRVFNLAYHYDTLEASSMTTYPSTTEQVLSIDIPQFEGSRISTSKYDFHKPSGQLYQYQSRYIAVYDLSRIHPHLDYLTKTKGYMHSCLRLSSTSLAITDSDFISVLDIKYSSVRTQVPLRRPSITVGDEDSSEKLQEPSRIPELLSYFPSSGTIICLLDRTLLAFPLARNGGSKLGSQAVKRGTLADAIGNGSASRLSRPHGNENPYVPPRLGESVAFTKPEKRWKTRKHNFNAFVEAKDSDGFDKTFFNALDMDSPDGGLDLRKSKRYIIAPADLIRHNHQITFTLSKIFGLDQQIITENAAPQLELRCIFLPTQTFQWLVVNSLLTQRDVESALRQTNCLRPTQNLPPCSIIRALANSDGSLQTLVFLLAASLPLTAREILCAMRHAIVVLQQSHNLSNMQLITAGDDTSDSGSDTEMPLVDDNLSERSRSPEPERDADKVHDAHAVMRTCLTRLSQYHDSEIQAAFKQELTPNVLLSFVDFLRAELAGGGWFSHYSDDTILPQEQLDPYSSQITIIAKLLNCTIDCLGASAWLLDPSASNESVNKIAFLKAEISAALEGIEEANYVQGLVHEVLLASKYAARVARSEETNGGPQVNEIGMSLVKPITVGTGDAETNALPLGLKPADYLETWRVDAGGEKRKRSLRDIGLLKSKKVGAYSFERILV